jgi:hypothetical protein
MLLGLVEMMDMNSFKGKETLVYLIKNETPKTYYKNNI